MLILARCVTVRNRAGFTLTELAVVTVLLGLVATVLMTVVIKQERFYSGTSQVIETRSNVREMAEVLPVELRGLSPALGDIYAMGPGFIDYRAALGTAVVCTALGTTLTIPPLTLASRSGLTSWLDAPQQGDSLLVYDQDSTAAAADDRWRVHTITASPTAGVCPTTSGFTSTVAEAAAGITLTITPALTATTLPGAAIRFFRRARYQLYLAGDGNWYLGFYDCLATRMPACSTIEPIAGAYLPPGAAGGLVLTYFDDAGNVTADPLLVSRIDLIARSQSMGIVRTDGRQHGRYQDSLAISVAVRN